MRFTVGSVTGWPITPVTLEGQPRSQGATRQPSTIWYVFDSAYCYREVACFAGRGYSKEGAEAKARALCERLNEEHAQ